MTRRGSLLRLLALALLAGLALPAGPFRLPAARASGWTTVFFDDFSSNTGWNTSDCGDAPGGYPGCQWPGQIVFGHNDGGATVLRLAQDGGVTFPVVGRTGLFGGIPGGAVWAFEVRFRFPQVTDYGVGMTMGSGSWTSDRAPPGSPLRSDWQDAFIVHQDTSGSPPRLRVWVFGALIWESPSPDTAWHVVRVEASPNGAWRAYVDGAMTATGAGAFRPNLVHFGNYYEVAHWGNWSDLHVDYLRVEYWRDTTPPVTTIALDPSAPNGDNGWYRTPVQVTLSATDDSPPVQEIRYRVNGGSWNVYSGPFTVSSDGIHVVEAYAIDRFGNVESPAKSVSFRIDRTPPSISWTASPATPDGNNGWYRSPITITFSCSDQMSGIASCGPNTVITAEGANLTAAGTARDRAGNTATVTAGPFRRDATPPSVTGVVNPPPNEHGWNRTPVTITWNGTDALSGIESCDPSVAVSGEGAGQTRTGSCRDRAGNVGTASVIVNLDFTPPVISGSRSPPPNEHGWNRTDVTVTWTCSDGLSGILACPGPTTVTQEGENQSVSGTARDRAGNERSAVVGGISIDKTPPMMSFALEPPPNEHGWNRTPVTIVWSGTDALSGIESCDPSVTVSDEGGGQTRTGACRDRAGNTKTVSVTVHLDFTPPAITGSRSPEPNEHGWNRTDVTVTWACSDALSGILACPNPTTVTQEGENQSVSGTARDRAGNERSAVVGGISIDKTPPMMSFSIEPPPNEHGWHRTPATITWSGTDALSGIAACDPPAVVSEEGEGQVWTGLCRDRAGNTRSLETRVSIDLTPPRIQAFRSPLPNANGWVSVPVTVTFECDDFRSGIDRCPEPVTVSTEGADQSVSGTARDRAGNASSTIVSGISIDMTPPQVSAIPDRSPNVRGWYTAPFTVTWSGADALSGIARCDRPIRYDGPETANGVLAGACMDRADLRGAVEFDFRYDSTPPTITFAITPSVPNGQNGWWTIAPAVDFRCEDETSGVVFCSHPVTVTAEGITTVLGVAEDDAGWRTTAPVRLQVDLNRPSAGLLLPASWCFPCSGPVGIGMIMEDAASGVSSWSLRMEASSGVRILEGTAPAEMVSWDGRLDDRMISPGETVTVTLAVTDTAGWVGAAQAFLVAVEPPAPVFRPPFQPVPTKTPAPTPTPTRVRPVPTRTPTPTSEFAPTDEPAMPGPEATAVPAPTPMPPMRMAQMPPAVQTATVLGVVFLDRNGNGIQDPGEPGVMGAVLEVMGRRITTGPDGRFYVPAAARAVLVFSPVRGRLTVADGIMFGVQPLDRPWWLAGLAAGLILLAVSWALDPRPREIQRWSALLGRARPREPFASDGGSFMRL